MGDDDLVTLRLPPSSSFINLPKVALAALLRIHQIDPGGLGDLATSVQQTSEEMIVGGDGIEINYRLTETEIQVELLSHGRTTQISAPRT